MKLKRLSKFQTVVLVVVSSAGVHYFLSFYAMSQGQMKARFHQHKPEFEQLRLMLKQDANVKTIGSSWVTAKQSKEKDGVESHTLPLNISQERLLLYRSRLKDLGFSRVDSSNGIITMAQFAGGFTDTTWSIGYACFEKHQSPLAKSAGRRISSRWHFSLIEDDWYIYRRN